VEADHQLILLGNALVLLSIFAGLFSARFGAPLLLVFLGLGMLAGAEGPGGILFQDFHAAYLIGSIGLAIILFDGGLRTDLSDVHRALWPSLALATIGVIVTAAIVGVPAALLFSTSWTRGLLVGAIVAPTDAAAVSALLHLRRLELRARRRHPRTRVRHQRSGLGAACSASGRSAASSGTHGGMAHRRTAGPGSCGRRRLRYRRGLSAAGSD
jgi:cell volume regulation protein A